MPDVTRILSAIDAGDPHAAGELLPLVYDELRKLAAAKMAHEKPGQTLDATGLVHEAYIRLLGRLAPGDSPGAKYQNRGHFFAAAATALGISDYQFRQKWAFARAWLKAELENS